MDDPFEELISKSIALQRASQQFFLRNATIHFFRMTSLLVRTDVHTNSFLYLQFIAISVLSDIK